MTLNIAPVGSACILRSNRNVREEEKRERIVCQREISIKSSIHEEFRSISVWSTSDSNILRYLSYTCKIVLLVLSYQLSVSLTCSCDGLVMSTNEDQSSVFESIKVLLVSCYFVGSNLPGGLIKRKQPVLGILSQTLSMLVDRSVFIERRASSVIYLLSATELWFCINFSMNGQLNSYLYFLFYVVSFNQASFLEE